MRSPQTRPITGLLLSGAAIVVALCSGASSLAGPTPPTVDNPNRFAVTGGEVVQRLFRMADTRRIDFAIIGDSNVRNSVVSGHEDGLGRAYSARFGCYATRVDPFIGTNSWAASVGGIGAYGFNPFRNANNPDPTAPGAALQYAFPTQWFPNSYGYLAAGVEAPVAYNGGLRLDGDHPINSALGLRYHLTHYLWRTPTNGRLSLTARGPAYTNFAAATFSTASSTPGLSDVQLDVPAGPRDAAGLLFAPSNLADNGFTRGPFFGLWQRVENPDRATGIAFSPLLYQGGRSARSACIELNNIGPSSPALQEWLRQVTRLQQGAAALCIQIMHGGNDAGDGNPSVGPIGGLDSHTAAGHADNIRGIINNLRTAWAVAGHDSANLFFILGPYHPRGDRLDLEMAYENQWVNIAGEYPNTIAIRGTQMSTEAEFIARGWMLSATDFAHLSIAGYRGWGAATVEVLQRAACPADVNHDRANTVQDVFEFLGAWFAGLPQADFDGSGGAPMLDDIFAFLGAWFGGC